MVSHTAFTFRCGGHLVTSGSEIFWSNWRVSVEGGILWVPLPLLLQHVTLLSVVTFWAAGSCHLSPLKLYLRQLDNNFGFTV